MYTFINGVEMNKQYPDTFWIPSDEEKDEITAEASVKIGITFEHDEGGERFWVLVKEVTETGFKVTVDNHLVSYGAPEYEEELEISREHVLAIFPLRKEDFKDAEIN
jgi:hypothetical protein